MPFIESWLKLCFNTAALAPAIADILFSYSIGTYSVCFSHRFFQMQKNQLHSQRNELQKVWRQETADGSKATSAVLDSFIAIKFFAEMFYCYRNLVFHERQSFNCIKLSSNQWIMEIFRNETSSQRRFIWMSMWKVSPASRFFVSNPIIQFVNGFSDIRKSCFLLLLRSLPLFLTRSLCRSIRMKALQS